MENRIIEFNDQTLITDEIALDSLLFKAYCLLQKNRLDEERQKEFNRLIKLKIQQMTGSPKLKNKHSYIQQIKREVKRRYQNHLSNFAILENIRIKLIQGEMLLNKKIEELNSRSSKSDNDKYQKIELLEKAIGDENNDVSIEGLIKLIHHKQQSGDPIELKDLHEIERQFMSFYIFSVYTPLKKYNNERSFLSKLKEWASDIVNTVLKRNSSTSKTLSSLKAQKKVFTKAAQQMENIHIAKSLFPTHTRNKVIKLYSNAYETPENKEGCFTDMFKDIDNAQESLVIVGWAIDVSKTLGMPDGKKLSERLYDAVNRGVKVTIIMWGNIVPCQASCIGHLQNLLNSIDPEKQKNLNIKISRPQLGLSDHQKMVVVDAKKLYIGGIDLTHPVDEIQNWHDTHIAVSGNCVVDALQLIGARWTATKEKHCLKTPHLPKSSVHSEGQTTLAMALHAAKQHSSTVDNNDTGTMQLLAGISKNAYGFSEDWKTSYGNHSKTSEVLKGHVNAVNNAQNFIFMENQYFIGPRDTNEDSCNFVIKAILDKIVEKHKNGEPFHFYCLLPYFPDDPIESLIAQNVMRRQWKTLKWFISKVNEQTGGKASDYITFYNTGRYDYSPQYQKNDYYCQKYPHSKLLIVDDHTMLIGSANLNERSFAGDRDSESMIQLTGQKETIRNFRLKLMAEHFGNELIDNNLEQYRDAPQAPENVAAINTLLAANLDKLKTNENNEILATPWGNIKKDALMTHVTKPKLIPDKSPLPIRLAMTIPALKKLMY